MNFLDQEIELTPAHSSRKWSLQQESIFDAVRAQSQAILVQAVAGSGKTTTIVEAMQYGGSRPVFLAFNKSIQTELASRITLGEAKTLNALGFAAVRRHIPAATLDIKKNSIHLQKAWTEIGLNSDQMRQHGFSAGRLMGVAKNMAIGCPNQPASSVEVFADLAETYWFTFPEDIKDAILLATVTAFDRAAGDQNLIDFDDQLYYPVRYEWDLPSFSDAFVDECQDLSPIQHLLLEKLGIKGTRIVAVGDRFQAIYGFRGAAANSMDDLKGMFGMIELPLSTTYRCPQSVVLEAQNYCPDIQARDGAPFGDVIRVHKDPNLWSDGSMILCRNNAPLFRAILRHVRAKEPCRVLSNFLEALQSFIRSFKCSSTGQLRNRLNSWYEKERKKAEEDEAWGKLAGLEDRYETLCVLAAEFKTVDDLLACLKTLSTSARGPIFSTIHKAKGLEAHHTYLLRPDLLPSRFAFGEAAQKQEDNLSYVAITRAQETFTYGAMKE